MAVGIVQRLGWAVVVLAGVTLLSFVLTLAAGDPARLVAGPKADEQTVAQIRRELGLDRPLYVQFARYVGRLLHGDLGRSHVTRQPVLAAITERLPATAYLALSSWVLAATAGILTGCLSVVYRRREKIVLAASLVALSVPPFWLGLVLLYIVAYRLQWLPLGGYGAPHVILPALALATGYAAYYARLVHTNMSAVVDQDYVRTARAKGLSSLAVYGQHALRNALIPVVTVLGLDLAGLMSGVVLTETIFHWPGVGRLAVEAVFNQDIPMILGAVLLSAVLVVLSSIVVDLLYRVIDPRVRLRAG
jgi:peptide/nickel transport system permease protein